MFAIWRRLNKFGGIMDFKAVQIIQIDGGQSSE